MEKMNVKAQAHIHSLGGQLAEVTIIEKRGDNEFVAVYNGRKYSAIFNCFNWSYYVDDIYGIINEFVSSPEKIELPHLRRKRRPGSLPTAR